MSLSMCTSVLPLSPLSINSILFSERLFYFVGLTVMLTKSPCPLLRFPQSLEARLESVIISG